MLSKPTGMVVKPTKITLALLKKHNACESWLKIFAYRFPKGVKLTTHQEVLDVLTLGGFGPVADWLIKLGVVEKINLTRANLSGADLTEANLTGADHLNSAQLKRALNFDAALLAALLEREAKEADDA